MANWRRKERSGMHRVKIPGTGWVSVMPGQPVADSAGKLIDCSPEVFGSQAENYIQMGVAGGIFARTRIEQLPDEEPVTPVELVSPPQVRYILQRRGDRSPWYDVVNPANPEKPINNKALKKGEATALLTQLLNDGTGNVALECPMEDEGFGKSFNEYNECTDCAINVQCGLVRGIK